MTTSKRIIMLFAAAILVCGAAELSYAQKSHVHNRKAAGLPAAVNTSPIMVEVANPAESVIGLTYSLPEAGIKATGEQYGGINLWEVTIGNALQNGNEGEPVLPVIPVQVVIPSGYSLGNIKIIATGKKDVPGAFRIKHGEAKVPFIPGAKPRKAEPLSWIYSSDAPYPSKTVELIGVQYKRGVAIAVLKIHPVTYLPRSGKLTCYESISFEVQMKKGPASCRLKARPAALDPASLDVENPETLGTYQEGTPAPLDSGTASPLGICNPAQTYQYVIITADSIKNATKDYTVRDLITQKRSRGISDTIVTTEVIYANYTGADNPEKIRNFIKDAYTNWKTDFILLGGDANIIPIRFLYCSSDAGADNVPSDLYYQCLDGNYNSNGNSYWGEPTDGQGGSDVDLMAEVNIGRASAESCTEMSNFVYKTITYENAAESSPYLRKAIMVGEYLGFGGVADYATATMEEIRLGSSAHGYTTVGFAASPLFSADTLYDSPTFTWSASTLISRMNSGTYSIYNHLGHANETYDMKLYNADADALTNNNFFFIYSQGCDPGAFDVDCFAEHLTTSTRHGAFAVVLNARYGWGASSSTDGPSQHFDRQFWNAYFGEFLSSLGALNAKSHEDNIWDISGSDIRWCMYETNLLGDPQTPLRGRVVGPSLAYSSHSVSDVAGGNGDGLINPGETVDLTLTVANVGTDSASGVTATVSSTDPYVTLVNGSTTFGTIQCCGATRAAAAPVRLSVASGCPTPHTVMLSCLLRDSRDSTWTSAFSITVYTSSQISGYVRTLTGGNQVPGATVNFSGPVSGSVTTNASGAYMFGGIDGTYSIVASATGYAPSATQSITVPPSAAEVNFALGRASIAVTPASVSRTVLIGDSAQALLSVQNNGDLPLIYTASADETSMGVWAPAAFRYDSTHYIAINKGTADTRQGEPQALTRGGPDSAGYRWIDSREAGGPAYVWNDISFTGRLLSMVSGCDDCNEGVTLSFPFPFYGNTFTSCYVGSNGYITFGTASSQYTNYPLPSSSMPANLIAGFFDDLYPSTAGDIYFQDFGDRAIIQFNGVSIGSSTTNLCTFQMVLHRDGTVDLYYRSLTGGQTGCTVGIQNGTETVGLNIVYNASYLTDSLAIELRSQPAWISVAPSKDTINPGQTKQLAVNLNSSGLYGGTLTGAVLIAHNAPQTASPFSVPCTLVVDGMRRLSGSPSTVNFGSCRVGLKDTALLTLTNSGDEATTVSSVTSTNGYFSTISTLPLTVPPFGNTTLLIVYQPGSLGSHTGTLTANSNAEDNPSISVAMSGSGVPAPGVAVAPVSFSKALSAGSSITDILSIRNTGGDVLTYSISTAEPAAGSQPGARAKLIYSNNGTDSTLENGLRRPPGFVMPKSNGKLAVNYPFFDGFESGNWNNWTAGSGSYTRSVTSATAASGNYSFTQIGGSGNHFDGVSAQFAAGQSPEEISFAVRTNNAGSASGYFVIDQGGNDPIFFFLDQGLFYVNAITTLPCLANVWYRIRFHINWTAMNFDFYVDNALVAGGIPFRGQVTSFTTIYLYNYDNAQAWWDNINVGNAPEADWLALSPTSGTVAPGATASVQVTFNSANLLGGSYASTIQIATNAPGQESVAVPCTLTVNGSHNLSAAPTALNFGSQLVGLRDTLSLTLTNTGNEATTVSSVASTNAYFANMTALPLSIPAFGAAALLVVYQPGSAGSHGGTLTITSNAGDNPSIAVALTGSGIAGPNIIVSPDSLYQSLAVGDSASSILTITNSGGAALNWTITPSDNTRAAAAPAPVYDASHFIALTKGTIDTRIGRPVTLSRGGPDRTGYTWIDSDEPGGPVYQWTDIKATGTILGTVSGCDDCFQAQKISFKFPFYGNIFDTIYVSSNGFITFGTGTSQISNYPLPSVSAPANLIDALHDDLYPSGGGDIYFKDYGDRVVVQFDNVYPYSGSGVYTFQIVLEKSGTIYLYYDNLTGPLTGATVGIQNAARDDGLTVAYNTAYLKNMLAVKFIPKAAWLGVSPLSGTVPAGQSASVRVSFNGAAVTSGTYQGSLDFFHNAASQVSPLIIPVTLQVTGTVPGMTGRVLSTGLSALPSVSGSRFRIVDLRMGSALAGQSQGIRYRAILK